MKGGFPMALVTTKNMFEKAFKGNYSIGAFNINNMEIIQGIVDSCKKHNSAVILQVSKSALKYAHPLYIKKMVEAAVEETGIDIALHLDHGPDFETCKKCIEYGFTSVMLDASRDSFEENIEKTKKVVELAAKYGATVEAELGLVGGSEDGKSDHGIRCTNPEDAKIFCEETGIDALAVAIGNAHGDYPVAPQLEFGVLEEIHNRTGIPLVLHGGSGITDADFQKAISLGIRKVNIATASFKSLTKEVENYLATEGAHNYFDMNEAMVLGTYKNVKHHIEVFNCK